MESDLAPVVYPIGVFGSILLLASGKILLFVGGIVLTGAVAKTSSD